MPIERTFLGKTSTGLAVHQWTLTNRQQNRVILTDWGATLMRVEVPNRTGRIDNITLGFDALEGYFQPHPHFGGTVGRYANRIARGKFSIDGKAYQLAINNGANHLHGGLQGFDAHLWNGETISLKGESSVEGTNGVRFHRISCEGEEGYPGEMAVTVDYTWNDRNELSIEYTARTNQATVVNLTNHAYFNLSGARSGLILHTQVQVEADQVLAIDEGLIPTGEFLPVAGTSLDFRRLRPMSDDIDKLPSTHGYDHCYVVRGSAGELRPAARAYDPHSGRTMEVLTTQPGMQLYSGNHLKGDSRCGGFGARTGFCFEAQHFPDSPNHPHFPTTLLKPGDILRERTLYRFGCA
jgi:aldose 1-epimerase